MPVPVQKAVFSVTTTIQKEMPEAKAWIRPEARNIHGLTIKEDNYGKYH